MPVSEQRQKVRQGKVSILQILEGTVAEACKEMDALHRLVNGIALLDVLQSFATMVSSLVASCSPAQ